MLKRLSIIAMAFVLMFAIVGCSSASNSTTTTTTTTQGRTTSETVETKELPIGEGPLFHNDGWPIDNSKLTGVPVPNFSVQPTSVTTGQIVEIVYDNVPQNEMTNWIDAIKQAGFKQDTEKKSTTEYVYKGRLDLPDRRDVNNGLGTWIFITYTSDGHLIVTTSY